MKSIPFKLKEPKNLFAVPAGKYSATLKNVTTVESKNDMADDAVRFIFDVTRNESGPVEYLAKKEYTLHGGQSEELLRDMDAFFEPFELSQMKRAQKEIDLVQLIGRSVDIYVVTKCVPQYKVPFSKIDGIFRAGTLLHMESDDDPFDDFDVVTAL